MCLLVVVVVAVALDLHFSGQIDSGHCFTCSQGQVPLTGTLDTEVERSLEVDSQQAILLLTLDIHSPSPLYPGDTLIPLAGAGVLLTQQYCAGNHALRAKRGEKKTQLEGGCKSTAKGSS